MKPMIRYLTQNPAHIQALDFARTNAGFGVHFARNIEDMPATPSTSFTRAKHTLHDGIGRLEALARDATRTDAQRHDAAKGLYDRMAGELRTAAKSARAWAKAEAAAAGDDMQAVLRTDPGKASIYSEIRAHAASRKNDPDWPAELAKLTKINVDVAVAISSAPGFLSGISEERQRDLSVSAMQAFAPEAAERLLVADRVSAEADRMEHGIEGLRPAFYSQGIADQMGTRVQIDAPFATGPIVNAVE